LNTPIPGLDLSLDLDDPVETPGLNLDFMDEFATPGPSEACKIPLDLTTAGPSGAPKRPFNLADATLEEMEAVVSEATHSEAVTPPPPPEVEVELKVRLFYRIFYFVLRHFKKGLFF